MPVVPFTQRPSGSFQLPGPAPDEQWSLMAAAQMHTEGRLIQPVADTSNSLEEHFADGYDNSVFDRHIEAKKPTMTDEEASIEVMDTFAGAGKIKEALDQLGTIRVPAHIWSKKRTAADSITRKDLDEWNADMQTLDTGSVILRKRNGPTS